MADEVVSDDLIDIGSPNDLGVDALPTLEKKYHTQMRQIVTQKIELPISALISMIETQIDLNPDFQRRERWHSERQSRFIESLIMNVPVPPVFLGEDDYGKYVVLDGRQRLTAVSAFLRNEYKLKKLEIWEELNGSTYSDLVKRDFAKFFTRRFIPAVVILKESSSEVKYDVFDRLNTGGVVAEPMEIRNAIYRGQFTKLLEELARVSEFCQLWGIPVDRIAAEKHPLYQRMADMELVLRFFALYEYDKMDVNFRDYLSEYMGSRNKAYIADKELAAIDAARLMRAVTNSLRIFGTRAFERGTGAEKAPPKRSAPLADAIMIALADHDSRHTTEAQVTAVQKARDELFTNEEFVKAISAGTNGRTAIRTRIELARIAFREALAAT
jgi:hypothetical protein